MHCVYIFNEIAHGNMDNLITPTLSLYDFTIYLFQIFSALNLCYIENEMSYHDLHCRNILFINDEYKYVDHDLYNIIIEIDDKTNKDIIMGKCYEYGIWKSKYSKKNTYYKQFLF